MPMTSKEMIKSLKKNGFIVLRQRFRTTDFEADRT